MQQITKFLKLASAACLVTIALLSCEDNSENPSALDNTLTVDNATLDNTEIIAATQEVLEITAGELSDQGISGGRVATSGRKRHHPYTQGCQPSVTKTINLDTSHPDSLIYTGSITLDYGDGSTCADTVHFRSGKIIDEFMYMLSYRDSVTFSSKEIIKFEAFKRDSTTLQGTFTSMHNPDGSFVVSADDP